METLLCCPGSQEPQARLALARPHHEVGWFLLCGPYIPANSFWRSWFGVKRSCGRGLSLPEEILKGRVESTSVQLWPQSDSLPSVWDAQTSALSGAARLFQIQLLTSPPSGPPAKGGDLFPFALQNTSSSCRTMIQAALFHTATNARSRQASTAGKVTFPLGNSSPALEEIIIFRRGKFLAPDELRLREMLQTRGVFYMADGSKEALLAQTQPSALKLIPERKIKCLPEALGFADLCQKNPGTLYQSTGHSCLLSSLRYRARTVLTLVAACVG